jgi:NAD(P)-dependent dehydrogenase (short-subunit alcohol dehydrogenase family)
MKESVVLVTGGAGHLGEAVSRRLLQAGARVAIPIYKTDTLGVIERLSSEFGDRLHHFALDLTTERGAEQAIQFTVEWGGRLDGLVHLVGGYTGGPLIAETDIDVWDRMMDLNLKSAWLVARAALPVMATAGRGSFVFVSSRAARSDRVGHTAYAVAKSALLTLVESIAEEYGEQGIRANAVLPGTMDTPGNRRHMPKADSSRWTQPDEIARVILFLASNEAAPINGASIPVYGRS